jgi:hypothetical protein
MYGQTQIPTGLQTAIQAQMEREVMSGQAKTMTSDETPTVFGQLMQQVAPRPAGVGQAMEQAGLAGQIQAMKMQQAQQALMQQAMAQQPQMMARGGLANLNVDIDGFADGGIVGYADGAYVKNPLALLLEKIKEAGLPTRGGASTERAAQADRVDPEMAREILAATTPMQEIPEITIQESTPPSSPREQSEPRATGIAATSPAAAFYDQARGALEKLKSSPVSQQAGVTAGLEAMAADDEMRRKLGLPTLAEQYARMSEEDKALVAERQALIAGRLREAQEKRSSGQLGAFLRSARGRFVALKTCNLRSRACRFRGRTPLTRPVMTLRWARRRRQWKAFRMPRIRQMRLLSRRLTCTASRQAPQAKSSAPA